MSGAGVLLRGEAARGRRPAGSLRDGLADRTPLRDGVADKMSLRDAAHEKTSLRDAAQEKISLRDRAYETIKHRIITCAWRPGEYINEAAVCDLLGIGRTPVHQALDRLRLEGMVEVMPRKGVIVQPVSLQEVLQVVEVRLLNETHAARLAAERAPRADLARLEGYLLEARAARAAADTELLMLLDRAFHRTLAQASLNHVLSDMLARLMDRSLRFWFLALNAPGHVAEVQEEHEAIVAAIRARDPAAAALAMGAHIESFRRNLLPHL